MAERGRGEYPQYFMGLDPREVRGRRMLLVAWSVWIVGAGLALANGLHAGVRAESVPVLGAPLYLAPDFGWSAPISDVEGGTVRMFVAPTEQAALDWYTVQRTTLELTRTLPLATDEAVQGAGQVLWRDGNVVALVTRPSGALDLAQRLVAALEPHTDWPAAPKLIVDMRRVEVDGAWAAVRFETPAVFAPGKVLPDPVRVMPLAPNKALLSADVPEVSAMAWDAYGRGHVVRWP